MKEHVLSNFTHSNKPDKFLAGLAQCFSMLEYLARAGKIAKSR